MSEHPHALTAEAITVKAGATLLLDQVSLSIPPGQVVALIGPNGAGKSTLMKALSGERVQSGECRLDGKPLKAWDARSIAKRRAVLAQHEDITFPLTVLEVVLLGRHPHLHGVERPWDLALAEAALERVGVAHLMQRKIPTLSGGERQRVRIARALVQLAPTHPDSLGKTEPRHLLLDEPCAGLDLAHARALHALLRTEATRQVGIVIIEHDLSLAALADRVVVLKGGQLVADGPPAQTLSSDLLWEVFQLRGSIFTTPAGGLALDLAPVSVLDPGPLGSKFLPDSSSLGNSHD